MLRKFTFALAVVASTIALIPDSASAWGRFGGFGGFGARFGGSHFGGFRAGRFGGSQFGGFRARSFGGSHFGGFRARSFGGSHFGGFGARRGGSRVGSVPSTHFGASRLGGGSRFTSQKLGGGPNQRPTTLAKPRPTIQRLTTLAKPRPTIQRPPTLAKPRPAIQRPTTLAKPWSTQSSRTRNPSLPASGKSDNMMANKNPSSNPGSQNKHPPYAPGKQTGSPGHGLGLVLSDLPLLGGMIEPGFFLPSGPSFPQQQATGCVPGSRARGCPPASDHSAYKPEPSHPTQPPRSDYRPQRGGTAFKPPGISYNTWPPIVAYEPEPSRPTRPPRPGGGMTMGMGGGGGGGRPALRPQWRIAPPAQPPTGVAGKPSRRNNGSAPVIPANEDRFVRDEVLVEFRPNVSPQAAFDIAMRERLALVASQRLELIDSTINRYQILDGRSVPEVVAALARDSYIVSTQPNYLYRLQQEERGSPQEPYPRARMHLDAAHTISEGGGTLVAVIDTIIDPAHPEIAGSIADSVDLIRADPKPDVKGMETYENALVTMSGGSASEPYVHGTAIAAVIAAHNKLTGVAPKAGILAVRAFAPRSDGRGAQGTTHNIVTGIDWAFKHGARVVNLSFGGPRDELLSYALAIGVARRMTFVASVGNEGEKAASLYPAADENVIAATASDEKDGIFKRANQCSLACVAAPGVDLRVAAPPAEYRTVSGTSLAAAHIAGVAALVLDKRADLEPRRVREVLFDAAKRSSQPYPAETSIAGVVDAYETLEAALIEPKEPTAEVTFENSTHAPYIGVNPD
jgi:subtilisin family serine protease